MKKWGVYVAVFVMVLGVIILSGCEAENNDEAAPANKSKAINAEELEEYVDARYRGIHDDRGENQVNIQFYLEDDYFSEVSYRQLEYDGIDYQDPENIPEDYIWDEETITGIGEQYESVLEYLEGEHISILSDLHEPGDLGLEPEEVDGMTAATIRASKVISAARDALNRGEYDNLKE